MATETPPAAPPPTSKVRIFLRRLFSFVVLWAVVLTAMFSGNRFISNSVFLIIMVALAGLGLAEFYGLAAKRELVCFKSWGIFGGVMLIVGTFLHFTGKLGIADTPARVNDFETSLLEIGRASCRERV